MYVNCNQGDILTHLVLILSFRGSFLPLWSGTCPWVESKVGPEVEFLLAKVNVSVSQPYILP